MPRQKQRTQAKNLISSKSQILKQRREPMLDKSIKDLRRTDKILSQLNEQARLKKTKLED